MNYIGQWVLAAAIRALKTAAQAAIGVIGAAVAMGDVLWPMVFSAAGLAAVVSILTSIAGIPEVDNGTSLPSMIHADYGPAQAANEEEEGHDA